MSLDYPDFLGCVSEKLSLQQFFYKILGQCLYFSFLAHKQYILSQLYTTALLSFPKFVYPSGIRTRVFCY
jgi:hypothetical protein